MPKEGMNILEYLCITFLSWSLLLYESYSMNQMMKGGFAWFRFLLKHEDLKAYAGVEHQVLLWFGWN